MNTAPLQTEVVIVGGGLGGLSLAVALGAAGIDTLCIEQTPPGNTTAPRFDGRTTAVASGPQKLLERLRRLARGGTGRRDRFAASVSRIRTPRPASISIAAMSAAHRLGGLSKITGCARH